MISEFLKIKVVFSVEPWQTLNKMKRFRNALAHAKPQKATEIHEVPEGYPDKLVPIPKENKTILLFVNRKCRALPRSYH